MNSKIKTERESALATYGFIKSDVEEGLDYHIGPSMYNEAMEGISSEKRITEPIAARTFCRHFSGETAEREGDQDELEG